VENVKTGDVINDDADVLLSARGNLNDIAWPKIPGLSSFKGEIMHSAAWNEKLVLYQFYLSGN
jgi:cation diffusion facilitator CzcD-associated flavoprotein CzcO